jgi:hypothetical protein
LKEFRITRGQPVRGIPPPQGIHLTNLEFCLDKPSQLWLSASDKTMAAFEAIALAKALGTKRE